MKRVACPNCRAQYAAAAAPAALTALVALVCLGAVVASPAPVHAGSIQGRIEIATVPASGPRARDPYAGHASSMPQPRIPVRGAPQDAVIYLESIPEAVNAAIPGPTTVPKLTQLEQCFVPRVVAVPVGGSVEFPNLDPIYHSVFSVSPAKRFDLGRFGKGKSKSVRFLKPGLVNVYCDIHSNMEGFVLVVPNRAFASPDGAGRYSLPELPPGRYAVKVWHPDAPAVRREVVVPAEGDVTVDLRLAP